MYVYIAPPRLALKSYGELEQVLANTFDEQGKSREFWQKVGGSQSTSSPAASATDANPSLVKKAS